MALTDDESAKKTLRAQVKQRRPELPKVPPLEPVQAGTEAFVVATVVNVRGAPRPDGEVLGQLGTEYERLVGLPAGKHAA